MEPAAENSEPAPTAFPAAASRVVSRFSSNREIAVVQADYLALANDLEQAQALAASLEIQLSGKTNELARFKVIWERTQSDLAKLSNDLDALRKERHALANEAQRGAAYQHRYERLKAEHDELSAQVGRLESELARERAAHTQSRAELDTLHRRPNDGELRATLIALRAKIDAALGADSAGQGLDGADHIEIHFDA